MVLVALIMLCETVNALLPALIKQETFDMSAFEEELRQFEIALSAPDTIEKQKQTEFPKRQQLPKQPVYSKKAYTKRPPMMIEINTADSNQLVKLYGIGPSFAGRILKYRGMLGGFFSIEQLMEVYGMDSIRYDGFRNNIHADTKLLQHLNVNEADFKTLLRHPYLDYETVKLICNYREASGLITCPDTLRIVIGYDPMFEKVKHYIKY